ncbi:hypothetical protein Leryth_012392 [Lithospermum erythrorhizon]|nr:hypothetical protein Leryth_012392 [Lithospermum erythrorhizon]
MSSAIRPLIHFPRWHHCVVSPVCLPQSFLRDPRADLLLFFGLVNTSLVDYSGRNEKIVPFMFNLVRVHKPTIENPAPDLPQTRPSQWRELRKDQLCTLKELLHNCQTSIMENTSSLYSLVYRLFSSYLDGWSNPFGTKVAKGQLIAAPIPVLAHPRRTPQHVVWGQFASSQSPIIGSTAVVSSRTSWSAVKTLPHSSFPRVVSKKPKLEVRKARTMATSVAMRALSGLPAPSSLPTLAEIDELRAEGNVYIRDVVCITIAEVASATSGLSR